MLGILGGAFDPVHVGHLRLALELRERVALERVLLMVAAEPPHREPPQASAQDRLAMVRLAVEALHTQGITDVQAEDLELRRRGPSYMADSLERLREREGDVTLALILGTDAFLGIPRWHRWRRVLAQAHLIVAERPDATLGLAAQETPAWAQGRIVASAQALRAHRAGRILRLQIPALDISATAIRAALAQGRGIHFLAPSVVGEYIERHNLYTRHE